MVFASYKFLFVFLPIALAGYRFAAKLGATQAVAWLVLASLAFYAAWNPAFVLLLIASIAFNFTIGRLLVKARRGNGKAAKRWIRVGVAGNLLPLFFFKYLGPILSFAHSVSLIPSHIDLNIILPLGISFFTFTQIGYLVDCYNGKGGELDTVRYAAFVTLFPHLIAGPILHIRDIGPQLLNPDTFRIRFSNLSIGTTYFIIGLAKKTLLADPLAGVVAIGFAHPNSFQMFTSWSYALAYSLQLYFDFSGYSDMAIGLAYMFGIRFPINFNSPYKATSIIDFWQRWHITLTRYLMQLLYNPLALHIMHLRKRAGKGTSRADNQTIGGFSSQIMTPVFFTMTLAGIWHGAGLQYLVFGVMHAAYLTINHAWRIFGRPEAPKGRGATACAGAAVCKVGVTYAAVVASQVMFRASSVSAAGQLMAGMIGMHGIDPVPVPGTVLMALKRLGPIHAYLTQSHHFLAVPTADSMPAPASLLLSYFIVWAMPNSQSIMARFSPALTAGTPQWFSWRPNLAWAMALGVLLAVCLMSLQQTKVFLYFQF
jgi:alginate O-acetyltransferase complex protein AlgI